MECSKHPGSEIIVACVTCDTVLVCVDCITGEEHRGHVLGKINTIANDIKTHLRSKEEEDRKLEAELESDLNELKAMKIQQNDDQKERIQAIKIGKEVLVEAVNEIADKLMSRYETLGDGVKLEEAIDDDLAKLEKVRRHKKEVKRIIAESDDIAVVDQFGKLIRQPLLNPANVKIAQGKVNSNQLKLMIGGTAAEMNEMVAVQEAKADTHITYSADKDSDLVDTLKFEVEELTLKSTFTQSTHMLDMCNASIGKIWANYDGMSITLMDIGGNTLEDVPVGTFGVGLAIAPSNTLLLCGMFDKDIKQITVSRKTVNSIFSTGKLIPNGLCIADNGDLYVTLVDVTGYNVTSSSNRALVQYSPQGQEKARASRDQNGYALFVWPQKVRISTTGNVLGVINLTNQDNNHLVLLNADLTFRLRYLGNGNVVLGHDLFATTTYNPATNYAITDFLFDSFGNIIIGEHTSKSVQLLSKDCILIRTLLPMQEHATMSMTMNDEEMWLGFKDGTVKVYKYK